MRLRLSAAVAASLLAAACSHRPPAAPPPPPPAPVAVMVPAPMPVGARVGMRIPARLPDGRWATPNVGLSAAGTTWHLRAALNVAVLACHGPQQATMVNQYNTLLNTRKAELANAQTALQQEYRATRGKEWEDAFDDQMTRLYNFFAQDFAHGGFCAAAGDTLGAIITTQGAQLPAFAAQRLPILEAPFTDFFTAYDRWRSGALVRAADSVAPAAAPVGTAATG
ncbi:hypothetical protein J2Y58_002726 [Sphingomonas sp. BE138]|uniref:hypothetical protein n=1 Tax=Sphingomonas sp. BE138 TaxID=2817845 RepID=UPI002865730B|nr:hypothetical protein [Sphingomonas sp. BE138]MDR6789355.1 hypothetical protein [Sphingomonas sp. BE138]